MKASRLLSGFLAALLALLAPGPQAWAAVAKTGVIGTGQSLPGHAVPVVPISASTNIQALSSGFSLSAPGVGSVAIPEVRPHAGLAAPAQAQVALVQAPIPFTQTVSGIVSEAAPHLEAVAAKDASPGSLRSGAEGLQAVLEGIRARPAAPADISATEAPLETSPALQPARAESGAQTDPKLPAPELSPAQKQRFYFYSGAVSAVKVGIEALNLAVPMLLLNTLHAAMAVSTLYLAAEVASIFAGLAGGALIDRIGARKGMFLTGLVQAAAIAGVPLAIASGGTLALPIVYGLFMLNGVAGELFDVARRAALPQIVGQDEGLLRKYNGGLYVWREIAATAGVFGAGWLVHHLGAMSTIWAHPIFCVAAAVAALRLLKSGAPDQAAAKPAQANPGFRAGLSKWWSDIKAGTKYVIGEKKLRSIILVNIPLTALHKIFHTLMAVVYATQVLHSPAMAAIMLGAWNVGELAGAFYLERWGRTSRLSNWMRLAAAASLAVWAYWLLPVAWVAVAVSFLLAAAMIGNELGTASYMQATVPQKELGAVTGFVYGFARAVGMVALLASGLAFDKLGPMGGFMALGVIFTVCAPIYLLASRRFKSDTLEPPAQMPQD